jgi:hypothetical protein
VSANLATQKIANSIAEHAPELRRDLLEALDEYNLRHYPTHRAELKLRGWTLDEITAHYARLSDFERALGG